MSNPVNGTLPGAFIVFDAGGFKKGLGVFVASVNVADPAALTDNNVTLLSVDATGRLRVQGPATGLIVTPAAGAVFSVSPAILGDSPGTTARAVAPAAGAAIATIAAASLPAGTYDVQVLTSYDGAVAAAERNNMEFREGAVVRSALLAPSVANVVTPVVVFRVVLDGATAVSVNATAAGTVGVGYNAQLVAIRVA